MERIDEIKLIPFLKSRKLFVLFHDITACDLRHPTTFIKYNKSFSPNIFKTDNIETHDIDKICLNAIQNFIGEIKNKDPQFILNPISYKYVSVKYNYYNYSPQNIIYCYCNIEDDISPSSYEDFKNKQEFKIWKYIFTRNFPRDFSDNEIPLIMEFEEYKKIKSDEIVKI